MMKENNSSYTLQYSLPIFLKEIDFIWFYHLLLLPSLALHMDGHGLEPAGPRNDVRSHDCVEGADDSVEYPVT